MRAIVLSVFITDRLGQEMFRVRYATLAAALTLLLTIAPVYAAPNLKVGSTASYSLASSVSATQSCSASPASYYNEDCLRIDPPTSFVTIYDNLTCTATKHSCGSSQPASFASAGTIVVGDHTGRLTHSLVAK